MILPILGRRNKPHPFPLPDFRVLRGQGCVQFLEPQDGFVTLVTTNGPDALEADTTVTVDYGNGNVRVQTVASPPRTVSYAGSVLQISWGTEDRCPAFVLWRKTKNKRGEEKVWWILF